MKKTNTPARNVITTREELIYALCEAAEVEHGLTCAYLFTAFSMKKFLDEGIDEVQQDKIRNWKSVILRVAHQEMEHLGLVCNMLNAIGGPQHFDRPNLPQSKEYYQTAVDMQLSKFSLDTLAAYMAFEKPDITAVDNYDLKLDQIVPTPILIHNGHTVQELYEAILNGFIYLDSALPGKLFIGNPDSQVDGDTLGIGFSNKEYGVTLTNVTDLKSAKEAIRRIIEQGEGVILSGDKVKEENKALTDLYRHFDSNMIAFNAITVTEKNWAVAIKALAETSKAIQKNLVNAVALIKEAKNKIIAEGSLKTVSVAAEGLAKLSKEKFSAANEASAAAYVKALNTTAANDAEGAIIYEIVVDRNCHYLAFWNLYQALKAELATHKGFEPARRCADNPMLNTHPEVPDNKNVHIVTHPYTRKVLELFNAGYETMVDMLIIFYSNENLSSNEHTLFMNTAFFPFMTMFIRPVGEVLSMLPLAEDEKDPLGCARAGGSFEYYINTAWMPRTTPRWAYLAERLQQMAALSTQLQKPDEALKKYLPAGNYKNLLENMNMLAVNMARISENFNLGMNIK